MDRPTNVPTDRAIYHLRTETFPQFRFELHYGTKHLYVIRIGTNPERASLIAENCLNEGMAVNSVLLFLRGYRAALEDNNVPLPKPSKPNGSTLIIPPPGSQAH